MPARALTELPRNDVRQYDLLVDQWTDPAGGFAMLYWLAEARARLVPPAASPDALLVDIACGGGLFGPHARRLGYRHVGVDLSASALGVARRRGMLVAQGDAGRLPLGSGNADVVLVGEILEHVTDLPGVVAEACRVLRPGGRVVLDTIADTWFGRFTSVTIGERIPGGPPRRLHDPALFVDRHRLRTEFARHGVEVTLSGLRLPAAGYLKWAVARFRAGRRPQQATAGSSPPLPAVQLRSTRFTGGLFQGSGTKAPTPGVATRKASA
jgi:2-polyprenyl-6-hydroxyphenyl methylase/3-demethylubiquinone-9 3-methyltransferase